MFNNKKFFICGSLFFLIGILFYTYIIYVIKKERLLTLNSVDKIIEKKAGEKINDIQKDFIYNCGKFIIMNNNKVLYIKEEDQFYPGDYTSIDLSSCEIIYFREGA